MTRRGQRVSRARWWRLSVGTKSVLFGAHCFCVHPWAVALAWWRLYGFPWDPRLWVAFFVHDLGYWGKPNMDGLEGEDHPWFGAAVMGAFDVMDWTTTWGRDLLPRALNAVFGDPFAEARDQGTPANWFSFALYHSRFMAKRYGMRPSRLCVADKLALSLTPGWLYLPMTLATGELAEYRALHDAAKRGQGKYARDRFTCDRVAESDAEWYARVQDYCARWAWAHRDGGDDTWTQSAVPIVRQQGGDAA